MQLSHMFARRGTVVALRLSAIIGVKVLFHTRIGALKTQVSTKLAGVHSQPGVLSESNVALT